MKNMQLRRPAAQHAQCTKCGKWFPISRELNDLIMDGIIHPVDIHLCEECEEELNEQAIFEAELESVIKDIF